MQLEDYFEFEKFDTPFGPADRIRIKGHRISIEHVLEYHQKGMPPEAIQRVCYPSLSVEQIYATITYYLHNRAAVDEYLKRGQEIAEAYYQEHLKKEPSAIEARLRALRATLQEGGDVASEQPTLPG